jgi:transposase InsO family protein
MCVFVCCTTRFPIIIPLKDALSVTFAKAYLQHVLPYTGGAATQELWVDAGSNQASVLMRDFTAALGIEARFAFPGRQQANAAEVTIKRMKEIIRRTLLHVPTHAPRNFSSADLDGGQDWRVAVRGGFRAQAGIAA